MQAQVGQPLEVNKRLDRGRLGPWFVKPSGIIPPAASRGGASSRFGCAALLFDICGKGKPTSHRGTEAQRRRRLLLLGASVALGEWLPTPSHRAGDLFASHETDPSPGEFTTWISFDRVFRHFPRYQASVAIYLRVSRRPEMPQLGS